MPGTDYPLPLFYSIYYYYLCGMELSNLSLEELVELRNTVNGMIHSYKDGFFYICKVRSYGRNWNENHINTHNVQELCYQYFGEDGIVDVYSNNPDLRGIDNYGEIRYVPTPEDYEKWKSHRYLKNSIPNLEEELDAWDNRDNVPFAQRPRFAPYYTREELEERKKELEEFDMSFVAPVNVKQEYSEE